MQKLCHLPKYNHLLVLVRSLNLLFCWLVPVMQNNFFFWCNCIYCLSSVDLGFGVFLRKNSILQSDILFLTLLLCFVISFVKVMDPSGLYFYEKWGSNLTPNFSPKWPVSCIYFYWYLDMPSGPYTPLPSLFSSFLEACVLVYGSNTSKYTKGSLYGAYLSDLYCVNYHKLN